MSLEVMPLGKVLKSAQSGFASGERAEDGVIQLRMNNVNTDGTLDWSSFIRVPTSPKQDQKYDLHLGDVLFNSTNSPKLVGKTAFFVGHNEPIVFSNHFIRLRVDSTKLNPRLLAYWLTVQWQQKVFKNLCTQWVNQASVRKEDLLKLEIPLPPLDEQQRIAGILARADRLRRLRRFARDLSAGYLQSVFLEMFGDPVENPMGWERTTISQLGEVQTGNTPPRKDVENYGEYIEWIKSDNIQDDRMFVTRSREMLSGQGLKKARFVESGAILITCIAGSLSSIGTAALTDRRVSFNQQINAVTPFPDVDSYFLYGLLKAVKPFIQMNATASMKHMITKSKLQGLVFIKPSFPLQQRFAEVVRRFEQLRAQQVEAERQAESLFQSLLARAFTGEM